MNISKESVIKSFFLAKELDDFVVDLMFREFQKPGLILLPSGATFEDSIYPKLDQLFAREEFQTFNSAGDGSELKTHEFEKTISPELKLSHLDELVSESEDENTFANAIKQAMPNIASQIKENFYAIDVNNIDSFTQYIKVNDLRLIFAGLGANPENAHVAFIGEDFINSDTCQITLSEEAQEKHNCKEAVTIGTDIFKLASLEKIYVVAKGESKAASLAAAFEDDSTGLGYLIANHPDKLVILADQEALSLI